MVMLLVMTLALGCEDPREAETTAFEAAEVEYRQGNYGDALDGYQAFLKRYPQSPLAPTVEMRIRSIHREVSSVMNDRHAIRPSYHGSEREQSRAAQGLDAFSPDAITPED
jgi:outer membrane protein assembly factor BamD (BamD/ComL family)